MTPRKAPQKPERPTEGLGLPPKGKRLSDGRLAWPVEPLGTGTDNAAGNQRLVAALAREDYSGHPVVVSGFPPIRPEVALPPVKTATVYKDVFPKVAKGRRIPGQMNKMETRYAAVLDSRMANGEVVWWKYEGITLKLGPDVRLTVDFFVMLADGSLEAHETKGFYRDDSRVKLHVAAQMYPFRFWLCKEEKGLWKLTTPFAEDR